MRKVLAGVAAMLLLASSATSANAYSGDWYYDNNVGGREVLHLGDNSDGSYRVLRGTGAYCGRPGASYATMRSVLRSNGTSGEQIAWWVSHDCGDFVRVCVENYRGRTACSTYIDQGWR